MKVEIREYKSDDLDSVNNVLDEAFSAKKSNFDGENYKEIVAVCDDKVSGYLLLTKVFNPIRQYYYCLVDYVCVASNYRGLNVSDKMIYYAEDIARKMNCKYMQLSCSTFRESAHKLYQRCGFVKRDSSLYRKELVWY